MKIVIPMSGLGQRFIDAGYETPKPLIEVDGKPIIAHVVDLFPGEENFIFICNEDHLLTTNMRDTLKEIAPNADIVSIPKHKLGPVFAVQHVYDLIDDNDEVIVNYCDFGTYWDYKDFLEHTRNRNADGAIPSYKGFHPHMLGSTNYAFIRAENQWMLEIQEKKPFTDNRMEEFASNGTYYFRSGKILKQYFDETMNSNESLNGEFYVSVVFNKLVKAGLKVSIYEIQHMLQWGTPEDVEEYKSWSSYFATYQDFMTRKPSIEVDYLALPMAGLGTRFANIGYEVPKPLIEVNGKPMVINAIESLPKAKFKNVAILESHEKRYSVFNLLQSNYNNVTPFFINKVTEGQASTCQIITNDIPKGSSLIIGACDSGVVWDENELKNEIENGVDVLIFAFKNHPHANKYPNQYGWIESEGLNVKNISVKQSISNSPSADFGVVGIFYFKDVSIFSDAYKKMISENDRVNNEFYVDSLINHIDISKFRVRVLPVNHYICWGTPEDYKTFKYWQSYFHKSKSHSYSLYRDKSIPVASLEDLISEYTEFHQLCR